MNILILTVVILVCSAVSFPPLALSDSNKSVKITKGIWATGVNENKQPSDDLSDTADDVEQLYFWTLVQGNKSALKILETQGKLPIRHKWYRYYGVTPTSEGSQIPIDAINLHIGKVQILSKLRTEVNKSGYFNWRTWSMKQNITPGLWVIKVVYADGSPVYCEDINDSCEYRILIK